MRDFKQPKIKIDHSILNIQTVNLRESSPRVPSKKHFHKIQLEAGLVETPPEEEKTPIRTERGRES